MTITKTILEQQYPTPHIACSRRFLCILQNPTTVLLRDNTEINGAPPILPPNGVLIQSPSRIISFALSDMADRHNKGGDSLLACLTESSLFLWNLDILAEEPLSIPFEGRGHGVWFPEDTSSYVSVAIDNDLSIYSTGTLEVLILLQGHKSPVTAIAIHRHFSHIILSISEDQILIAWDLENPRVRYHSPQLSYSAQILTLAILYWSYDYKKSPSPIRFAVGTEDGIVECFELDFGKHIRSLAKIKVLNQSLIKKEEKKPETIIISKQNPTTIEPGSEEEEIAEEHIQTSVLYLKDNANLLYVGTSTGFCEINLTSYTTSFLLHFRDDSLIARGIDMVSSPLSNTRLVMATGYFDPNIHLYFLDSTSPQEKDVGKEDGAFNVFPCQPLEKGSPLLQTFNFKKKEPQKKKKTKNDKPLTFHSNIRSSGYSHTAERPNILAKKNSNPEPKQLPSLILYPTTLNFSSPLGFRIHHSTSLSKIFMSSEYIFTSTNTGDFALTKLPLSEKTLNKLDKRSKVFRAHSKRIIDFDISHSNEQILSSSDDGSFALWTVPQPKKISKHLKSSKARIGHNGQRYVMKAHAHTPLDHLVGTPLLEIINSENTKAPRPKMPLVPSSVSFFYLDKFLLCGESSRFLLYKYNIDVRSADLKRVTNLSQYKNVSSIHLSSKISHFSCHNAFLSNLVVSAHVDKHIRITDIGTERVLLDIDSCHNKPMSGIHFYGKNSPHCEDPNQYNIFLTTSSDGIIKLWDLRKKGENIQTLSGHISRGNRLGVSWAPNFHYIASGSEDKSLYIYDLRMGTYSQKIPLFSDSVTDCCFNPTKPEILVSSNDGSMKILRH